MSELFGDYHGDLILSQVKLKQLRMSREKQKGFFEALLAKSRSEEGEPAKRFETLVHGLIQAREGNFLVGAKEEEVRKKGNKESTLSGVGMMAENLLSLLPHVKSGSG